MNKTSKTYLACLVSAALAVPLAVTAATTEQDKTTSPRSDKATSGSANKSSTATEKSSSSGKGSSSSSMDSTGSSSSSANSGSNSSMLGDAAITAKVKTELIKDKDVSAMNVNVDTSNGIVTLKGTAKTRAAADKAAAPPAADA